MNAASLNMVFPEADNVQSNVYCLYSQFPHMEGRFNLISGCLDCESSSLSDDKSSKLMERFDSSNLVACRLVTVAIYDPNILGLVQERHFINSTAEVYMNAENSDEVHKTMSGEERETLWISLKKSFQNCKSEPAAAASGPTPRRSLCSSTCSRSLSNLRDVIHGSKRHPGNDDDRNKVPSYSPRSLGSADFLNPVTHEVVLSDSTSELKITMLSHPSPLLSPEIRRRKAPGDYSLGYGDDEKPSRLRSDEQDNGGSALTCRRCSKQFKKAEEVEQHQASDHAVTELAEGDSSRRIVEIIFRTSWPKSDSSSSSTTVRIERVLKVNNSRSTLTRFEQHREKVKLRATKLSTKHPRCLADGNELLRFHGTTVACSLGTSSSVLCGAEECGVCGILRRGFGGKKKGSGGGGAGVFTASTSKRALEEAAEAGGECGRRRRKVLVLCRVIAGRVHKPVENVEEMMTTMMTMGSRSGGFDSVAGKMGQHSSVEELYLLDGEALLPCFLVICKP